MSQQDRLRRRRKSARRSPRARTAAARPGQASGWAIRTPRETDQRARGRVLSRGTESIGGVGETSPPTASPFCLAQTGLRVPTCVGSALITTSGRRSKPLAGSVWRGYQVRWCLLHPHLLDLREPTTARNTKSRRRTSAVPPPRGRVKGLEAAAQLSAAQARIEHVAERVTEHVEPEDRQ